MPGASGSEKRALPGQVLVRLTAEAEAAVQAHAAAGGLTIAAWARGVIADAAALPVDDRRPVPARRRKRVPAEDLVAIAKMTAALNRHNAACIQLVKTLRQAGMPDLRGEVEDLIRHQARSIPKLFRVVERIGALDVEDVAPPPHEEAA